MFTVYVCNTGNYRRYVTCEAALCKSLTLSSLPDITLLVDGVWLLVVQGRGCPLV